MGHEYEHKCELEEHELEVGGSIFKRLRLRIHGAILASENNSRLLLLKRSVAAIKAERKRQLTTREYRYVIHPHSRLRMIWQMVMMVVYGLSYFFIPFVYAIHPETFANTDVFKRFLLLFLSILCFVDIFMNFLTGYIDETRLEIVLERKLIARKYLLGYFVIDVVHSVPLDFILWATVEEWIISEDGSFIRTHMDVAFVMAMFRLLRIPTFFNLMTLCAELCGLRLFTVRLVRLIAFMVLFIHLAACIAYSVPFIVNGPALMEPQFREKHKHSWVNTYDLHLQSAFRRYTTAVFYVSEIFGTTGFCFNQSILVFEDVVLLGALATVALVVNAYLLVSFMFATSSRTNSHANYMDMMNQLEKFMQIYQLPEYLQDKFIAYYEFRYDKRYFNEHGIMSSLPEMTRYDLNMHACRHLVENVSIFYLLPREIVRRIVARLKPEIVMKHDAIIRAGTKGDCMYFLSSGTAAVITVNGKEVCHLVDGAHFGEVCLVHAEHLRMASVVAVETCDLYRLDRADFESVGATCPEFRDMVEGLANERAAYAMKMNEAHKAKLIKLAKAEEKLIHPELTELTELSFRKKKKLFSRKKE